MNAKEVKALSDQVNSKENIIKQIDQMILFEAKKGYTTLDVELNMLPSGFNNIKQDIVDYYNNNGFVAKYFISDGEYMNSSTFEPTFIIHWSK